MMVCVKINTEILHSEAFKTNASKLVWFCLMRDVDDTNMVKTSALSIAKEIGVNEKTVRNALNAFQKESLIELQNPILSPKKFRYIGRIIKLNVLDICCNSKKTQFRKKSDIQSDIQQTVLKQPQDGFERFREWFNNAVDSTSIPQITKLTDARKNALRSIFKEYGKETVEAVIQKVIASDFLTREWGKVSFDWIFKKANFIKILEGNYDNISKQITTTDNAATRKASRDRMLGFANSIVSQSADKLARLYNGGGKDSDNL